MVVGVAVGSEDLHTCQRGQWAGLDYQLDFDQLTCMAEPQTWEQLHLWASKELETNEA